MVIYIIPSKARLATCHSVIDRTAITIQSELIKLCVHGVFFKVFLSSGISLKIMDFEDVTFVYVVPGGGLEKHDAVVEENMPFG